MALNHFHGMGYAVFRPNVLTKGNGTRAHRRIGHGNVDDLPMIPFFHLQYIQRLAPPTGPNPKG